MIKYDLKGERLKRNCGLLTIRNKVVGVGIKKYKKMEEAGEVTVTALHLLHKQLGFSVPHDFYFYTLATLKLNCIIRGIRAKDFINVFADEIEKKEGEKCIKRSRLTVIWGNNEYVNFYEYKDIIDKLFPELYLPCLLEGGNVLIGEDKEEFVVADIKKCKNGEVSDFITIS